MQEQDKTLDKSWSPDRLLAKSEESPIWEEVLEEDRLYNLSLGDAIFERASFLLIPLTKVARAYKDIGRKKTVIIDFSQRLIINKHFLSSII